MKTTDYSEVEIAERLAGVATLAQLLGKLEFEFMKKSEVLCQVEVNGVKLDDRDEQRLADAVPGVVSSLSVLSSPVAELVEESITSALSYSKELRRASIEVSELYRQGSDEAAHSMMDQLMSGARWLVDLLMHLRAVASRANPGQFNDWIEAEKNLLKVLKEILVAFERKDLSLLADLLEYELSGSIELWLSLLEKLDNSAPRGAVEFKSAEADSNSQH